ncbi:M20/M25/M40 family metallo-hydrolase [Sphingomonas corticis]|uniref:M20/M25/M40 family metallo-hydrolase n=1 Tax=Sphingomonas corticis TaxID=2722791 RepID=A0ABX1CPZ3_9SPHN|nr:M20/M25/M40 family metallo-hydrolase [Sphingomonas corticis]NJR79028.1 M20/M25/M40 family metallo-hydrolase [Sphingomonas corticis]
MKRMIALAALLAAGTAQAQQRPDQTAFRALYKELVETNTALSNGSCTDAAAKMAVRLKAAGFRDEELTAFADPAHPKDGGLVAVLPGTDSKAKAILLLAHIDVVEAKREDWTRDPFTLIEEGGYFYGRGTYDDKAQAAIFTDMLARFRKDGTKLKRTVKLALTCGEETTYAFNGAEWLAKNRPELIAAEFALNEGGGGRLNAEGKPELVAIQAGEKAVQNFRIEATNPGGHSSRPRPDNAIYELADALEKVRAYRFPVRLNDATRAFLTNAARQRGGEAGAAMTRLLANPQDAAADALLSRDPDLFTMLRTTCVATLLDGGHANNALPQRAGANINCRVIPGESYDSTEQALAQAIGDPKIKLTRVPPDRPVAPPVTLTQAVVGPAQTLARKYFPGVPFTPTMLPGGTDAVHVAPAGIPVYGVPGLMIDPDGNGIHGLNERIRVDVLYKGRDYLTDLVKAYAAR